MYVIYNLTTGAIRITVSSLDLAETNLGDDEAFLAASEDEINIDGFAVVDGQIVPKALPVFEPVLTARELRKGSLTASDWTQTADSPLTAEQKTAWAHYRQGLRDFPAKIAEVAADEDRAAHVSSIELVEELLPTPPDGG